MININSSYIGKALVLPAAILARYGDLAHNPALDLPAWKHAGHMALTAGNRFRSMIAGCGLAEDRFTAIYDGRAVPSSMQSEQARRP